MAVNSVTPPFFVFADATGAPLEAGSVFIGQPGLEAQSNPKASFFDLALTIPTGTAAGLGIRTIGGYPSRNGSAATIFVDGDFSVTVLNKNGSLVFSALNRQFQYGIEPTANAPVQAPDGTLGVTGFGFLNEVNTGLIRSAPGAMQLVALGVPAATVTNTGIVLAAPLTGPGARYPNEEPNSVINSDFSVSQRGAPAILNSTPGRSFTNVDRWYIDVGVLGQTISLEAVAAVSQIGHLVAKFFGRVITTLQSGVTSFASLSQRIEGARSYSGQTITVLGWGQRSSAGNISVGLLQNFGTGGSPSASVVVNAVNVALGAAWGPWKATLVVPSVVGKTFGTNNNDSLELRIFTSAGSSVPEAGGVGVNNVTVDLFGIHIRPGDVNIEAINFYQTPDPCLELTRCQRFFERKTGNRVRGYNGTGAAFGSPISFTPKRAVPTTATANLTLTNANSFVLSDVTLSNLHLRADIAAGPSGGSFTVDVDLSAEL